MPGHVIGEKMGPGFAGTPSRMSDCVIVPYIFKATATGTIQFGEPVVHNNDGTIIPVTTDTAANAAVIGIAVRRLGQPHSDSADGWYYKPGDVVDVLVRGSISVPMQNANVFSAPVAYNATTHKYVANNGAAGIPAVPNAKFSGSYANGIGEITLTERKA